MPTTTVIGRDAELDAIRDLLDRAASGPVGLVVEGEAGIGKSVLLEAAVEQAAGRGFRVLGSRAAEAEASWSLLAVGDLLDDVPEQAIDPLPEPQRNALDVVMRRAESDGRSVEQATVGAAFRGVLSRLASEGPVLLVLDDVHWVDEASAAVLGYVLRRLGDDPIAVVTTRRLPEPARLGLAGVLPEDAVVRLRLGPVSMGALRSILESRLPTQLTRSTLSRVHDASQGNPLFALEIVRVLEEVGVPPFGEPLPVPGDVQELIRRRVADLPERTRVLLLRAALAFGPTSPVPPSALGERSLDCLAGAERAGVVRLDGQVLRFAHPFHAAAVLATAHPDLIQEVRRQLAAEAVGPEERARHLGRAVDVPDLDVARTIEVGAEAALTRGAPLDGALLLERACRLTPAEAPRLAVGRGLRAAEYYEHVGEHASAEAMLDHLLARELTGDEAAEALRLRAEVCMADDDLAGAEDALAEALALNPAAHRCALSLMAITAQRRDFERAQRLSRDLLERLDPSTDGPLVAEVLAYSAMTDFRAGDGLDWARIERALELEDRDAVPVGSDPPCVIAAYFAFYAHRYDEARQRLLEIRDDVALRGFEDGYIQHWLGRLETACGNLGAAIAHIDEGIAITALTGNSALRDQLVADRAFVDVLHGDLDAAQERLQHEGPVGGLAANTEIRVALAAGLSGGDPEMAWEACRARVEEAERDGLTEPHQEDWVPDAIELMIARGLGDRAGAIIEAWEERGRALGYPWALALGARCRAVLHAAEGDDASAIAAAEEALEHHRSSGQPFHRARTLLVLGASLRRVRRRADARRTLEEALAEFERMGCRRWTERAREELARIGGRSASTGGLSRSERRVVELAAGGASNKEIAATLSVSVHTIESHLSHAFVKLGVTRRGQLAGRLADEAQQID